MKPTMIIFSISKFPKIAKITYKVSSMLIDPNFMIKATPAKSPLVIIATFTVAKLW